jgi:hypothetical protein
VEEVWLTVLAFPMTRWIRALVSDCCCDELELLPRPELAD